MHWLLLVQTALTILFIVSCYYENEARLNAYLNTFSLVLYQLQVIRVCLDASALSYTS